MVAHPFIAQDFSVDIIIGGLRVCTKLGWLKEERAFPQVIQVSCVATVSCDESAIQDNIEGTVDYSAIVKDIKQFCEDGEWRLVERLLVEMSGRLYWKFDRITKLELGIEKSVISEALETSFKLVTSREDFRSSLE